MKTVTTNRRLLVPALMLLAIAPAMTSPVSAQTGRAPIRDPAHIIEKNVWHYRALQERNVVMQKQDYSCGAAALATVLRFYWGDNIGEREVLLRLNKLLTPEEFVDRVKNGLAITDLRRVSVEMGYVSTTLELTFSKLVESKIPLIIPIAPKGYDHFVVFRGLHGEWVYLADPIRGNIRLTVPEFLGVWKKRAALVVIKPGVKPKEVSQLSVLQKETFRGELNDQLIRTNYQRTYLKPQQ